MFKVRFAPQAIDDLEEIKRYISDDLFNPQAAADLVALVFKKVRELASILWTDKNRDRRSENKKTKIPQRRLLRE